MTTPVSSSSGRARTACALFRQAAAPDSERAERKLEWAAKLHEVGCRISHSDYHRHGAYILDHTDAAGFALPELHRLGILVLGQRGKVRKLEADLSDASFALQLICLRLAVALCHAIESSVRALRGEDMPLPAPQPQGVYLF